MPRKATSEAKPKTRAVRSRKSSPPPPVVLPAEEQAIDPEEIARLAFSYWLERGGKGGSAEEDWFRAEQNLKARAAGANS